MENYNDILEKIGKSKVRFDELTDLISRPEIIADNREWKKLVKERSSIEDIANAYVELKTLAENYENCEKDLKSETDAEMKELFKSEIEELKEKIDKKVEDIKILLLPKDEMMTAMPLLKFVRLLVEKNLHFSVWNFAECIAIMQKKEDGKWNT